MGALAGAVVGAIGGLFAAGVPRAILGKNPALLFATPVVGLLCFLICGVIGWLLGGQLGPRLGEKFNNPRAELVGGGVAGLLPVMGVSLWAWYSITH